MFEHVELILIQAWFLKNEADDPTSIDDDAIDEYVSKYPQPGGLRSMFNICTSLLTLSFVKIPNLSTADRATEANVKQNREAAMTKVKMLVTMVGSEAFIGKEVKYQMEKVAQNVVYVEFKFGYQLAEECPEKLAQVYLSFFLNGRKE